MSILDDIGGGIGDAASAVGNRLEHVVTDPFTQLDDLIGGSHKESHPLSWWLEKYSGWHGQDLLRAHGAVFVESRGKADAQNYCCTGLFQIHEIWAGKFGSPADHSKFKEWLKDPANNITMAYNIWKHSGWSPWAAEGSAWQAGTHFDPVVTHTVNDTATGNLKDNVSNAVGAVTDPMEAIGAFFSTLGSADTWFRIGKFVAGGLLIILGGGAIVFIIGQQVKGSATGKAVRGARRATR